MYSKSKLYNAAELSEEILLQRLPSLNIQADYVSFNIVISAWARSRKPIAFDRAQAIFLRAVSTGITLTAISYTSLLSALSRSKRVDAPELSSQLFSAMMRDGISPDLQTWTILIGIWSKHDSDKAQDLFEAMIDTGLQPNNVTYTTLLTMWGQSRSPSASTRILQIFRRMKSLDQRLDTIAYSSLLSALSSSNDTNVPKRAMEIFENLISSGFEPDVQAYTILIDILSRSPDYVDDRFNAYFNMIQSGLKPSSVTFSIILRSLKFLRHPKKGEWLETIFGHMCTTDKLLDGQCLNNLDTSLSTHFTDVETAEKVDLLVTRMLNYGAVPDELSCATVFKSWDRVKRNSTYVLSKSLSILDLMISLDVLPNKAAYRSLFSILGRIEGKDFDESVMFCLNSYRHSCKSKAGRGNPDVYNSLLSIYEAKAKVDTSTLLAAKSRAIVQMMFDDDCPPDESTLLLTLSIHSLLGYLDKNVVVEAEGIDAVIRQRCGIKESQASLNLLLSAWSKCFRDDIVSRSENVFRRIKVPSYMSYFYLFKSYSKIPNSLVSKDYTRQLFVHYKNCLLNKHLESRVFTVFLSALEKAAQPSLLDEVKTKAILQKVLVQVHKYGLRLDVKHHIPRIATMLRVSSAEASAFCDQLYLEPPAASSGRNSWT